MQCDPIVTDSALSTMRTEMAHVEMSHDDISWFS